MSTSNFEKMHWIVKRKKRPHEETAAIEALLSVKEIIDTNSEYKTKKTIYFNETLRLKELLTQMIDVCE